MGLLLLFVQCQSVERWEVTLQRSACFGRCPVYEVSINANGVIQFEGIRFVALPGVYRDTLSEIEVQRFWKMLTQLYQQEKLQQWNCPESSVTDVAVITLTIRWADTVYTARCDEFSLPSSFQRAVVLIDSTAQIERWVYGGTAR